MLVRPARVEDAAAIADVHVRTWQAAYAHVFGRERLATLDDEQRRRRWRQWLASPEPHWAVSVAEDDGEDVVAFAWTGESRDASNEGELYAIYALPETWGTGAGPLLLDAAVASLRDGGFAEAVLWVLDENPRARRFYEREGWRLDGARRAGEHLGVEVAEVRYRRAL